MQGALHRQLRPGAGGGGFFSGTFGGVAGGGYQDTAIGQIIVLAYIDAYKKMVGQLGGLPDNAAAAAPTAAPTAAAPLSFDLAGVSLDLDSPSDAAGDTTSAGELTEENPLETKLSLAEEFRAIGDFEGARSLAEEVLAEASGTLKTKAGTFLADLA